MAILWEPKVVHSTTEQAYWDSQLFVDGTEFIAVAPDQLRGSYSTLRFRRTSPVGLTEDYAQFGLHWAASPLPVAPIVQLTPGQAGTVESQLITNWWDVLKTSIASEWTFDSIVWRHFGADQPKDEFNRHKYSPVWRQTTVNSPATAAVDRLPDQCASTTSFHTGSRKHWGRCYVGGVTVAAVSGATMPGQYTAAHCDALANAMATVLRSLNSETVQINLWVWSSRYSGACSITEIQVDSVPDVIRRRRPRAAGYKKLVTS